MTPDEGERRLVAERSREPHHRCCCGRRTRDLDARSRRDGTEEQARRDRNGAAPERHVLGAARWRRSGVGGGVRRPADVLEIDADIADRLITFSPRFRQAAAEQFGQSRRQTRRQRGPVGLGLITDARISGTLSPPNAIRPVSISNRTQPNAKMSVR